MPSNDLAAAIEESHHALAEIIKGDVQPFLALYSTADDITIGNPFGPFAVGREATAAAGAGAASRYRDGEIVSFERVAMHVADSLASVVEVERFRVKVGGADEQASVALRVTSLFSLEDNGWRLVHRHADPITTPQTADSVIRTS